MSNQNEGATTYDVTNFTIREMTECGRAMRTMGKGAASMEEVAGRVVRYLYDTLIDGQTGGRACSLIRFFKTHAYEGLDDNLKDFAENTLGGSQYQPGVKCLTLLGTVGENPEWNLRRTSKGHKSIPLPSEKVVEEIPMIRNFCETIKKRARETKMNRTKIVAIFIMLISMITLFSGEALAEKRIGVLMWSEEGRYVETWKGITEQLKKDGFGDARVKFFIENAKGNKAMASDLAQRFASARMDMVIALGTSAAVAVAKEIKDVPVIFSMVWDAVDARIADNWKSSGNNTTGSCSKFPMSKLVSNLKQLSPIKKLAVIYTTGQKNSEVQLKELQAIQAEFQIKVVPVPLMRKEDVPRIMPEVARTVDAIYLSGSSVAMEAADLIVDIANKTRTITVTHQEDLVVKGVLLGIYSDPFDVGRLAGKKAVMILRGAKPSSIPIESVKKQHIILNMKTAKAGQIQIPSSFRDKVTKTIE